MDNIYFTVGPSQLYPTVKKHLKNAIEEDIFSISHRSQQFQDIFESAVSNIKKILGIPAEWNIFFLGPRPKPWSASFKIVFMKVLIISRRLPREKDFLKFPPSLEKNLKSTRLL